VTALLAYGIGKAINAHMAREDGPRSKWSQTVDVRPLGEMPNNPEMQNKLAEMTQNFPTPRVQTDDGNQDVADLHAREDLLLSNYTWLGQSQDQSQGKVRIPIERAMELLAQRGLPVATATAQTPLMTGDEKSTISLPLTSGFARTGYELDQAAAQAVEAKRMEQQKLRARSLGSWCPRSQMRDLGHPVRSRARGNVCGLRFVVSHPSRKDKNAARVGHPKLVTRLVRKRKRC